MGECFSCVFPSCFQVFFGVSLKLKFDLIMGRKGEFDEKVKKGPGRKSKKQGELPIPFKKEALQKDEYMENENNLSSRQKKRAKKREDKKKNIVSEKKKLPKKNNSEDDADDSDNEELEDNVVQSKGFTDDNQLWLTPKDKSRKRKLSLDSDDDEEEKMSDEEEEDNQE